MTTPAKKVGPYTQAAQEIAQSLKQINRRLELQEALLRKQDQELMVIQSRTKRMQQEFMQALAMLINQSNAANKP